MNASPKKEDTSKNESVKVNAIMCQGCGFPNPEKNTMCEKCGLYLNRSGFDPLSVAINQGRIYGKLTKPDHRKNAVSLIGRTIISLAFFITGIANLLIGIKLSAATYVKGNFLVFLYSFICGIFSIVLAFMIFKQIFSKKKDKV